MSVRLIATDLDGTLLRSDGSVSARTRAALAEAVAAGVELVLVTARPPRVVAPIAQQLALRAVAICANGALEYDLAQRRITKLRPLRLDTAQYVVAALAGAAGEVGFAMETGDRVVFEPGYRRPDNGDVRLGVANLAQLWRIGTPRVKLLAWSAMASADELMALAAPAVRWRAEVTHSGGSGLLEVSARGVTKVAALSALCARRGIAAAEVVAFGDMPNDLAMLEWAGTGYAVANAHPSVLAGAAARTGANDEDGVAAAVERLLSGAAPQPRARPGSSSGRAGLVPGTG